MKTTNSLIDLISREDSSVSSLADFIYASENVSIIGDGCCSRSRDTFILRDIINKWIETTPIYSKTMNEIQRDKTRFNDLLTSASNFADKQETIFRAELLLLRKIAETSSDLVKAKEWEEFRQFCGGIEKFEAAHRDAVGAYEQWLADGEGD